MIFCPFKSLFHSCCAIPADGSVHRKKHKKMQERIVYIYKLQNIINIVLKNRKEIAYEQRSDRRKG
jgi:hypothetical protein